MAVRVGVNGLGRIGRCVIRHWAETNRDDVEIVAINTRKPISQYTHLLKYDSTHGIFPTQLVEDGDDLKIGDKSVKCFVTDSPADIAWQDADVDVVLECTGKFKKHADVSPHLTGSVKKVLISAPAPDPDATLVLGVNNDVIEPDHKIISIGSCTTNCLAPVAKVLNDAVGIENGFMTTIHAYTNDQNILDGSHKDPRRARAAALSMIPTSTGAAKAISIVLPELEGKLDGTAIRVPTPNVSFVDFVFNSEKETSVEEIHNAITEAANGSMKGVLDITHEELVSIDFNHNPHSSIFDATQTSVINGKLCRVASWYDNEWGFSVRMLDIAAMVGC